MNYEQTFGSFLQNIRGVPVTVDYQYLSPEEGGPDARVLGVHLPGYPEVDVKECLDWETLCCYESNAMWHEQHDRKEDRVSNNPLSDTELASILTWMYLQRKCDDDPSVWNQTR